MAKRCDDVSSTTLELFFKSVAATDRSVGSDVDDDVDVANVDA